VAEGSGENIFIVKNNEIHTPPESASILSGITRNTIISLVKEMGLKLHERTLTRSELYLADEVFFTGTAAEVTPIREIDGRKVGTGSAGAVTLNIQKAFFDLVRGRTKAHPEWFTFYEI
jgi:branched-chain amino acid aminotransferase